MDASPDKAPQPPAQDEAELELHLTAIEHEIVAHSRLGDPAAVHRLIREWNALSAEAV